ncbi:hypothetical protein AEAC466_16150 [Asticcacaulis sp. AC466]|uniref:DUF2948 family protein n=1 Tax=Asticcacaulis sp. AC466 TaxID=1282362 RepID=UPI0003C40E9D|nr:DUF2948 family protein [Asticcacaulis sp. AC466]ESQ82671.1 hypothetical protein AEAC466_16150 [Asticcacaulis sp. AC466]
MGLFGFGKAPAKPLRLLAQDAEDLPAISALVQDAALRMADIAYDPAGRSVTLQMSRFCHEKAGAVPLRAPSVLRISDVTGVKTRGLDTKQKTLPLSLLDIAAEPLEAPAFALTLRFAGAADRDMRIEVECLDVLLLDLAPPRRAKMLPDHAL